MTGCLYSLKFCPPTGSRDALGLSLCGDKTDPGTPTVEARDLSGPLVPSPPEDKGASRSSQQQTPGVPCSRPPSSCSEPLPMVQSALSLLWARGQRGE